MTEETDSEDLKTNAVDSVSVVERMRETGQGDYSNQTPLRKAIAHFPKSALVSS